MGIMTKILITLVAISAISPVGSGDTATTQGFCTILPWMPYCSSFR